MRYKTREIGEGGLDLRVVVSEAWLAAECPEASLSLAKVGVALEGHLEAAGEGYLLRGTLRGELLVPCARCLEPATVAVDSAMTATFVEAEAEPEDEADEAREDVYTFEHGTVDLGRSIRDEILLAVPMSAMCRPDCAGICPTCGRNRNLTPCGCERPPADTSKLGALAKIKLQ
jgi:uncharacterized protein